MIITKISDGLGNQMFMYAHAYAVAKKHNDSLILDASILDCHKTRQFELDNFHVQCKSIISFKFAHFKLLILLLRYIKNLLILLSCKEVKSSKITGYSQTNDNFNNIYFNGYWQSEIYFKDYRKDLLRQFTPKFNVSKEYLEYLQIIDNTRNSVAIHIRLGDYIDNGWNVNREYYLKAIQHIKTKIVECNFFIFSDDLEKAKPMFGFLDNISFVDYQSKNKNIEDMLLISRCMNQIISNSTFSWWGAWLNQNDKKMVICPQIGMWSGDFYPDDWIQIPVNKSNEENK